MEGIDEKGIQIMEDLLKPSPQKLQIIANKFKPYLEAKESDPNGTVSEKSAKMRVFEITVMLDVRLGLLMMGTQFQDRANIVAEIVRKRLKLESLRSHNERREKLNIQMDKILQQ